MRRITASAFVSLDGVMQAPGGPEEDTTGGFPFGGWTAPYWDELTGESVNSLHERPFELLLGRKTYDIFAAHWPERDEDPIGAKYNRAAKHVVTTTEAPLSWANSRAIGDIDGVERLKESEGADLLIWGSSTLYPPLLRRGLIDRLLLMVFPVVLGPGKRLFGTDAPPGALKLVESKVSSTGVFVASYEPNGEVLVGSFASQELSEVKPARKNRARQER